MVKILSFSVLFSPSLHTDINWIALYISCCLNFGFFFVFFCCQIVYASITEIENNEIKPETNVRLRAALILCRQKLTCESSGPNFPYRWRTGAECQPNLISVACKVFGWTPLRLWVNPWLVPSYTRCRRLALCACTCLYCCRCSKGFCWNPTP